MNQNIVVLGAGFGGIACAVELAKKPPENHKIILVDKNNYHLYQAGLYETATTINKDTKELVEPIIIKIKNIIGDKPIEFIQDEVSGVDLEKKIVSFKSGKNISFSFLTIALGSETNTFGVSGIAQYALSLKTLNDAVRLHDSLIGFYTSQPELKIVIGGAGSTGIELAAELPSFFKKLPRRLGVSEKKFKIAVIEACPEVLPGLHPSVQETIARRLKKLNIETLLSSPIVRLEQNRVFLKNSMEIDFDIFVWTAGIKGPKLLEGIKDLPLEETCVQINQFLQVKNFPEVYAVGDCIRLVDPKTNCPVPAMAWIAGQQGKLAAQNIKRTVFNQTPKKFKIPKSNKFIIPLGGKYGVLELGRVRFKGFFAWYLKQLVALKYFLSVLPLVKAFKKWIKMLYLFTKND